MKFTTSVISGLALCVVNVVAQDFGSLPTCAQGCATNAIPASCGLDVRCICSTASFITSVSCCVATACDAADQQTTLQFAQQLCAGAGVTSLPSAAGCSATTGAATSAASTAAGTSSTVGAASTAVTSAKTSASAVSSAATSATTSATGTAAASSSAASTSHSGAATPMAKSNGVAAAGAGAAAILAAMCLV